MVLSLGTCKKYRLRPAKKITTNFLLLSINVFLQQVLFCFFLFVCQNLFVLPSLSPLPPPLSISLSPSPFLVLSFPLSPLCLPLFALSLFSPSLPPTPLLFISLSLSFSLSLSLFPSLALSSSLSLSLSLSFPL